MNVSSVLHFLIKNFFLLKTFKVYRNFGEKHDKKKAWLPFPVMTIFMSSKQKKFEYKNGIIFLSGETLTDDDDDHIIITTNCIFFFYD